MEAVVGIVILNYNNWEDTVKCVSSVIENVKCNYKIIVVDNCSVNQSYEELKNRMPESVVLIETGRNLGYAGGNNIGIKQAKDLKCDYICILNNDTIATEDFITPCLDILISDNKIGFIGPAIIDYETQKIQSTGGTIHFLRGYADQKNNGKEISEVESKIYVDYVGGACIIASYELLEKIGLIPECYFLFYEETEWCLNAKRCGYFNMCLTDTCIIHKGSVSVKSIDGLNIYLFCRNRVAFIRRNIGKLYSYLLFLGLCIYTLMAVVVRRDKKRLSRISFFYDGLVNRVDLKKYPFIIIKE